MKHKADILTPKTYFHIDNDVDFGLCQKDPNLYMQRKKITAEVDYIKFSILTKIANGDSLSNAQKQYLLAWQSSLINQTPEALLPKNHSDLTFGDLKAGDFQTLNDLGFTHIPEFNSFLLNDLVFEFNQISNTSLIPQFEQYLKHKTISENWDIPAPLSTFNFSGVNNTKKYLLDKIEKTNWKKNLKFSEEEISKFKEMFSLGRGSSKYDKLMLELDLESFEQFLEQVNDLDNREDMINICKAKFIRGFLLTFFQGSREKAERCGRGPSS